MRGDSARRQEVYSFLLELCHDLAERKLGGIFIISSPRSFSRLYEPLYPQYLYDRYLFDKGARALLLKLAELDGAFLIGDRGQLVAFGARIKKSQALPGYGTKHAAAVGITSHLAQATALLVSEENQWIKVFREGKVILELDPSQRSPSSLTQKVVSFLTDHDTALLASAGASAALAGVFPVVIISGTYLAFRTASGILRKNLKKS